MERACQVSSNSELMLVRCPLPIQMNTLVHAHCIESGSHLSVLLGWRASRLSLQLACREESLLTHPRPCRGSRETDLLMLLQQHRAGYDGLTRSECSAAAVSLGYHSCSFESETARPTQSASKRLRPQDRFRGESSVLALALPRDGAE